jgi:hypothetical protein
MRINKRSLLQLIIVLIMGFCVSPVKAELLPFTSVNQLCTQGTRNFIKCDFSSIPECMLPAPAPPKSVSLKFFLQGLYDSAGVMRKAQDESGDHFPGTIADQVTIELHNASDYSSILYTVPNVNLSITGFSTFSVPATYNGSYYITVKHRNSIATVTAFPVSFSGSSISFNFSYDASRAYGSNQIDLGGGVYGFYAGDINQDGYVDSNDILVIESESSAFISGYLNSDVNGDGITEANDLSNADNNSSNFISSVTP